MFHSVISLIFYSACERFQWYEILSFNYIFTHTCKQKKPERTQFKSNQIKYLLCKDMWKETPEVIPITPYSWTPLPAWYGHLNITDSFPYPWVKASSSVNLDPY